MHGDRSFGRWLKQRRKALDLTQEQLAKRVGCAAETLRKIETERLRPSRQVAARLAEQLALPEAERAAFVQQARAVRPVTPSGRSTPPAAPIPQSRHTTLPAPVTPLIGRAAEVAAVCTLLEGENVRLLTLVGPPGIGKTRLSLQVASDLQPHFADGVFFVELAPITQPNLVVATIAQALGVKEVTGQALAESLKGYLESVAEFQEASGT